MLQCVLRVSLGMACTIPLRLLSFSTTSVRVTLPHIHAPSILTRASRLSSNSMSQPAATDLNAVVTKNDAPQQSENADVVVQYVVLRRDLIDTWPLGSVVTQGCHASVSAVWSNKDDPHTVDYCSPDKIDSMHKVRLLFLSYCLFVLYSDKWKSNSGSNCSYCVVKLGFLVYESICFWTFVVEFLNWANIALYGSWSLRFMQNVPSCSW